MTTHLAGDQTLAPFPIGLYIRGDDAEQTVFTPTPLLDPNAVKAAVLAYDDALGSLRVRVKSSVKPGLRHLLANKILRFAVFGERDRRSLRDRALAHFP